MSWHRQVTQRDAAGNETTASLTLPIGHNPDHLQPEQAAWFEGGALQVHTIYDDGGNLKRQWGLGFATSAANTDTYSYEPGTSLKASEHVDLALGGPIERSFVYDASGHVTQTVEGNATTTSKYDATGKLTRTQTAIGTTTKTSVFTYETNTEITNGSKNDCLSSVTNGNQTTVFAYDGEGRRTWQGPSNNPHKIQYVWDDQGRLEEVYQHYADNTVSEYLGYAEADGELALMGGTRLNLDNGRLVCAYRSNWWDDGRPAGLTYVYDEQGRPYAAFLASGIWHDPLAISLVTTDTGDVVELVDANGDAFATYRYDPWGRPIGVQAQATQLVSAGLAKRIASLQVLRWHGYVYDEVSGLYFADGFWYDPITRQATCPPAVKQTQSTQPGPTPSPTTGPSTPPPYTPTPNPEPEPIPVPRPTPTPPRPTVPDVHFPWLLHAGTKTGGAWNASALNFRDGLQVVFWSQGSNWYVERVFLAAICPPFSASAGGFAECDSYGSGLIWSPRCSHFWDPRNHIIDSMSQAHDYPDNILDALGLIWGKREGSTWNWYPLCTVPMRAMNNGWSMSASCIYYYIDTSAPSKALFSGYLGGQQCAYYLPAWDYKEPPRGWWL